MAKTLNKQGNSNRKRAIAGGIKGEIKIKSIEDKLGAAKKKANDEVILLFGDIHIPYHHQDSISFLKSVKAKYKPTKVICTGDEVDYHALSYHQSDPDLPSAGEELDLAISYMKQLYKMFPKVDLVDSNHGSMAKRKGQTAGMPRKMMKTYAEILEAPRSWNWHDKYVHTMKNKETLFVAHTQGKNSGNVAKTNGCNYAQGHHHEDSNIVYTATPIHTVWGMSVGSLIDNKSMAFAYNKSNMKIPALSVGVVTNGIPQLIPMVLNKKGRWIGKL